MDNYLQIANNPILLTVVALLLTLITVQAIYFIRMALKRAEQLNISKTKLKKAAKTAAITSIVPSIAIIIALITLAAVVGTPLAWGRLSVIGSLTYELLAADIGANAAGVSLGSAAYDSQAFLTSVCTMTIGSFVTLLLTICLFKWYKNRINNRLNNNKNDGWSKILVATIIISMYSRFMAEPLAKGGNSLITMVASGVSMLFFGFLIKKTNAKWLKDFAISFSMIIAMIFVVLVTRVF